MAVGLGEIASKIEYKDVPCTLKKNLKDIMN